MNNDGLVNYADINPFVQALNNPAAYAYAHPGLGGLPPDLSVGGSRVWHGDLNCNDTLTYADINPLSTRIGQGCCLPTCGSCYGLRGGDGLSPQELAINLMLTIDPELFDSLVTLVAQAATGLDNEAERAYWQAVYEYLTE